MSAGQSSSNVFQRQAEATESVWLAIGRAAETMGDLERAQKAYERVLNMNPLSWRALTQAAHVCRCREDYPRAVEYFNRAIQIDDKNGDIWSSLGHCFLMQDELQSAYDAYQSALFHLPSPKEDAKLWYGIGILYDRYGSLQHAEEAFSSVLKMDQNFEKADEIYFRLGIIYKQLQRYSESLKCFDQILRNPPHPLSQMDIWFQIGHVYEQQKDYESARDAWDRVLTEAPNHAKVLQQLGWLYHQSAAPFVNQEVAVQYLTRSLATDPSDAQSWYLLGRAYMTSQKYNKAYEAYQQAVYRDGRNPTFWISIGVLYFQINQFKDALDAYSRAIRLNPYISEVWFDLGSLYESCNQQLKDAMDAYVRAKELDPTNVTVKERLELLNKHAQDSSIPLGPAPPPKDVHPTAYSNFQTQPPDAPPPMRIHSNSSRHSPPRHGFSGAGAPLPNGAYQPGPRAHSRHASPASMRYGGEPPMAHPRGGAGDDYRGRALPQPGQDVEMSDAHEQFNNSRPNSALGRRSSSHHHHQGGGYPAILPPPNHTQPAGSQSVPSMLHHPQRDQPLPGGSGSHRKHHGGGGGGGSSRRNKSPQRSVSPSPHLVRVRGLSPGGVAGPHGPSSSAAGGHYGSYGPTSASTTSRYGAGGVGSGGGGSGAGANGNLNLNLVERGRSPGPGATASSASGGPYGAAMPPEAESGWERERRPYAAGVGLPPAVGQGQGLVGSHPHQPHGDRDRDRGDRDRDRDVIDRDRERERGPPGPPIRVKEESREKNVRLPPPPPLGGSQQQQQQQQQQQHHQQQVQHQGDGGRRMPHDRHPSDDYDMRPPPPGQYGAPPYDYDRNGAVGRGRSPPSAHAPNAHLPPPQQHPHHRSDRRYDPLHEERGPPPPRQTSPFHPVPLRHADVSPYDDRRRGPHDENSGPYNAAPPHHAQEAAGAGNNRRRSGRVDKDEAESASGPEKGTRKRGARTKRDNKEPTQGYNSYGTTPQPSTAFSAPPPHPRSPNWQGQYPPEGFDGRNRSRASSTSFGGPQQQQQPPPPQHQRYGSDANNHRQQQQQSAPPVPPLVKHMPARQIDEDYDDPSAGAVDALMGLAGSSRAPPSAASVASTSATGPPPSSVTTVSGASQSPVNRPSSQLANRKRRRSGTGSSIEQPPHPALSNIPTPNTEPEKKKQRLETPPGREGSVQINGARRPSLEDEEDQLQDGSEKMQEDVMSPPNGLNASNLDAGGPNSEQPVSPPPFRRTSTHQSGADSRHASRPPSTGSQETMRHQTASPASGQTPVRSKAPEGKSIASMVSPTNNTPPEKGTEEKEKSRRSISHSHSRSTSMTNGNKASASPVS